MRSAFEQFVRDAGKGRPMDPKAETKRDALRRERPELFLTDEERKEFQEKWGSAQNRCDRFDDFGKTRSLLVGTSAPVLSDEGRAILRKEANAAASKKYRAKMKRLKQLEAEAEREQQHYENTTRANPDKRTPGDDGRPAPTAGRDEGAIPRADGTP